MIPYQFALRRRVMVNAQKKIAISITGLFDETRGYVMIDGVKYTSAQTLEVKSGVEIIAYGRYIINVGNTFNGENIGSNKFQCKFNAYSDVTIHVRGSNMNWHFDANCAKYKNLVYS